MKQVTFPDQTRVSALGQGTWKVGEDSRRRIDETAAIRAGVERGMAVIDTAEMYGEGATERFLGEALAGIRDRVFLVSKAYPHHAGRPQLAAACEASLKRLQTDRLDLYLLHWRGQVALEETVEGMLSLQKAGKIKAWGVSNLDETDMGELIDAGGEGCATNQILYNLSRRGPERDLMPWMGKRNMPVMAYSPIEQGRIGTAPALKRVAERRGVSPLQIALAWVLRKPAILAIPKASSVAHVEQNDVAARLSLDDAEIAELDSAFPAPRQPVPLQML